MRSVERRGEEGRQQGTMLLGPFPPHSCPSLALSGSTTLCSLVSCNYSRTAVFLIITPVSQGRGSQPSHPAAADHAAHLWTHPHPLIPFPASPALPHVCFSCSGSDRV